MFLILKIIWEILLEHYNSVGKDPRTRDLPLVGSYPQLMFIIGLYILMVKKIGPQFMANRKPYDIKGILQVYNVFQVLMNLYIFYGLTKEFILGQNYHWTCLKYDTTASSKEIKEIRFMSYLYFLNKILDFLDTIFFVLRKKYNQISFLHVYHHAIMVWGTFYYMNSFLGTVFTEIGYVNGLVHILMYTYYFLSSLDKKLNLDSWKKYMTQVQILQFAYFAVKYFMVIVNSSSCGYPFFWLGMMLVQNLFMTVMFSHFYYKHYIVKERRRKTLKD